MTKIGLQMIVKDEAETIRHCLDSIFKQPLIDYWSIVDTGSTDGTQQIIKQYFAEKGIPGELTEVPFTNFAECRNKALQGLKGKCDFAFWIDADDTLTYLSTFNIATFRNELSKYSGLFGYRRHKMLQFACIAFIRMAYDWTWWGYVHEYLKMEKDLNALPRGTATDLLFNYNETTDISEDKLEKKLTFYAQLLERQHEEEPDNNMWLFYLGQTYVGMKGPENIKKGIEFYEKRVARKTGEIDEVAYLSKYYALLAKQKLDGKKIPKNFIICANYAPNRIEHLIHVISLYQSMGADEIAYMYSSYAFKFFLKYPERSAFSDLAAYNFSCAYLHIVSCLYTRRIKEGLEVFEVLTNSIKSGASMLAVEESEMQRLKAELDAAYQQKSSVQHIWPYASVMLSPDQPKLPCDFE